MIKDVELTQQQRQHINQYLLRRREEDFDKPVRDSYWFMKQGLPQLVHVTPKHIEKGIEQCGPYHPLAIAIQEQLIGCHNAEVDYHKMRLTPLYIFGPWDMFKFEVTMSKKLRQWITDFNRVRDWVNMIAYEDKQTPPITMRLSFPEREKWTAEIHDISKPLWNQPRIPQKEKDRLRKEYERDRALTQRRLGIKPRQY